jgi:putative transposase
LGLFKSESLLSNIYSFWALGLKNLDIQDIALERYRTIEPFLKRQATLEDISKQKKLSIRVLYYWVKAFNQSGLNGLAPKRRSDKGQRRAAPEELINLVQGLFLRTPPVPISAIHRMVQDVCKKNGWRIPSYDVVHDVVSNIPPNLKTLAHEGAKAYKQAFGLLYRFEAERANEIWQADHTPLDICVLDSANRSMKPWLTAIVDDYSRAVPGYFLSFQPPSSMRIALALRQAIWRKDDPDWTICGIPEKFYSDCGSDFTSNHIDQVAIDLKFETIQTEPDDPQGKGKCERFFLTVNEMFLATLPGYAPKGHADVQAVLTLEQLEQRFRKWLVSEYLIREHSEINMAPKERWEAFPFVPRMPDSSEQLDLLLLTVTKTRRVRRDGIRFSGFRYFDVSLSGYIGEDVSIRYDPRDLGFIHVYSDNALICKAACFELSGKTVSLKDVQQARNHESKVQRLQLKALLAIAEKHAPIQRPPEEQVRSAMTQPLVEYPKFKIKRFACDDN